MQLLPNSGKNNPHARAHPVNAYVVSCSRLNDYGYRRLITNAEEIAFLNGSEREKGILNKRLAGVTAFSSWYFLLQFREGCIDQYVLKYFGTSDSPLTRLEINPLDW